jgi:hypothetical protein
MTNTSPGRPPALRAGGAPGAPTRRTDFDRHCAEILAQTSLLVGHLDGADVTVRVPTCPGWNVSQLARHVDGGQRWAREIVATRAVRPPSCATYLAPPTKIPTHCPPHSPRPPRH